MMNLQIKFGENLPDDIFSTIAEKSAKQIKDTADKKSNKNTQLRKFYDELSMWNDKVQHSSNGKNKAYADLVPFIKMLKAKAAYARSRTRVNDEFIKIFNKCIDEINSPETLNQAKLFMEAVIAYCKYFDPENN